MIKTDKKIVILAVLIIFSILTWSRNLWFGELKLKVNQSGIIKNAQSVLRPRKKPKPRAKHKDYKKNAFKRPAAKTAKTGPGKLYLKGVILDDNGMVALINDDVVRVGDNVGINKVMEISADKVILNDGEKDFALNLEE